MIDFDIKPKAKPVSNASTKYWMALKLPCELSGLSMQQLTALRKMVQSAYTAGRKYERLISH